MEVMSMERIWKWVDSEGSAMATLVEFSKEPKEIEFKKREVCDFGDCEQYYPTEGTEPSDIDKQMIAAAPDLLEALEDILKSFQLNNEEGLGIGPLMRARSAINKAKGIKP